MTELRRRDAARTRGLLLDAARARFTQDGYAATRLRDVADDAGVNVALVSRYFDGKEGLFAACLSAAQDDLRRDAAKTLGRVAEAITAQIAGPDADIQPNQLLLLLRSSGDERAEEIRLGILRGHAERLAATAGPGTAGDVILRAEMLLAAVAGIVLLRRSGLAPLSAATEDDLLTPLRDLVAALLPAS